MSTKNEVMFRVKYGFDRTAFLRVKAGPELEKAIYAWTEQIPVVIGGKMIQGKHIISIEGDFRYYTGWYETYEPVAGDDFAQIERDCPNFEGYVEAYRDRIQDLIQSNRINLIGTLPSIPIEHIEKKRLNTGGAKTVTQLIAERT